MAVRGWRRGPVIGRGSSAEVSVATALPSGHLFAVKSAELSRSAPLRREHGFLSALRSPFLVSCFGSDVRSAADGSGRCYDLFLELAARGSLADEIARRGGSLDEAAIRGHTGDVLSGLAYLHANGVVHCDVKARNVLLGADGRAKVADLGCARWIDGREDAGAGGERRGGLMGGTPLFMAPEVARGEAQGPAADVWALGCTVVEMATGRPPWPAAADPAAAMHRIAFSRDVPELPNWLSGPGKDFLSRCFARDPEERWTAEQLLEHEFVASSPAPPPKADHRWVSPKSTLDQAFGESLPEDEEEDEEEPSEAPTTAAARIQELASNGSSPHWTRDDDWVTIRSNGGGAANSAADNNDSRDLSVRFVSRRICAARFAANGNVWLKHEEEIQFQIWYWLFWLNLICRWHANFCLFAFKYKNEKKNICGMQTAAFYKFFSKKRLKKAKRVSG